MQNRFVFIIIALTLIGISLVFGCGPESIKEPESDPQGVIEEYFQWIIEGNYDRAYEMLANIHRDSYSKDDFALLYFTLNESLQLRGFRVSERERLENTEVGFVTYKEAVKYDVAQTIFSYYEDREVTNTSDGWVVSEDGEWRVYRERDISIEEEISYAYSSIGYMYLNGKGKSLDYRKASTTFRTALTHDPKNPVAHFGLGISLFSLDHYEEALTSFQEAFNNYSLGDNENRSHSLTWIGSCYEVMGNKNEARDHYKEAINIFPDNQWAIDGLERVGN